MSRRWPGPRSGTGSSSGRRPSWPAQHRTACSTACCPRFRCRGKPAVALTGRAALVALVGTLAALALRTTAGLLLVDGCIVAAILTDIALAASVRKRSEEHTSELQSRRDLVCRLL